MAVRRLIRCAALLATVVVAGAASSAASADVATARAAVDAVAGVPEFVAPGPAFTASKARGKKVFIVPASGQVADIASMSAFTAAIRQAGGAVGVKFTTCSNSGARAEQTICLNRAISSKADLVILAGPVDLVGLKPALAAVKKARIPVVAAHVLGGSDFLAAGDFFAAGVVDFNFQKALLDYQQALAGLAATVPAPFGRAARLMADYVTAAANGAPTTVLVGGASDHPASTSMVWAMKKEFASVCGPACTVSSIDIPYSAWQTTAIPTIKTAILARTTNYFLPLFDGITGLASQANADANQSRAGVTRPSLCSFGGRPAAIQRGQAAGNGPVVCDFAENMNWNGWATMDQALRVLTGNPPVAQTLPLRLWTANPLWPSSSWFGGGMTFPPLIDAGWGDPATTYIAGFRKLWGLS